MNKTDFYIGWQPKAPAKFETHIHKVLIVLVVLFLVVAVILAFGQKRFSTANFEYGQLTEIKGIYHHFPVPSIKIATQPDIYGHRSFMTIPLVGYGKFGAEGVIAFLEKEHNKTLDKMEVVFRGTLLYSDGKTLLQIDLNDKPLVKLNSNTWQEDIPVVKHLGRVQLTGEILDPKCYFGVMKPGYGKPHRDCAARCIEGGMSPVFYIRNEKGQADYYLILDAKGNKMNEQLKDHVGEPVELEAKAVQYDDWIVLYVDGMDKIKRTGGLSWFKLKDETISCGPGTK